MSLRRVLLVGAAAAALLISGAATSQARGNTLFFVLGDRHTAQPVDWLTWCSDCNGTDWTTQDPWVVNPTTCMFDTDDGYRYGGSGQLPAGASAGVTECSYEGHVVHATDVWLESSSGDLSVTETFAWPDDSRTVTVPAQPAGRGWAYHACAVVPAAAGNSGSTVEVPDSHGGIAVPVTITVNVANPAKPAKVSGLVEGGWINFFSRGCTYP